MTLRERMAQAFSKFTTDKKPVENLRNNLSRYLNEMGISLAEFAEKAGISVSTLNTILYGNSKNCFLDTAVAVANGMESGLDELVGGSAPEGLLDVARIWRVLPKQGRETLEWFAEYERDVYKKHAKGSHVIAVIQTRIDNAGNLVIPAELSAIDIADDVSPDICRKIICGLQLGVDFYMPKYSPYDVLLIANDRPAKSSETAVIVMDEHLYLARRMVEQREASYFSIRDGKYRVKESECDHIVGYVAGQIHDIQSYLKDGRY